MAGVPKPFQLFLGLPASFHYAVFLYFYEGRTQTLSTLFRIAGFAVFLYFYEGRTQTLSTLFRIAGFAVFLYFYEGRTQTLSTISLCDIVGFFASHLFTKASF
jgi:hypothetical protein